MDGGDDAEGAATDAYAQALVTTLGQETRDRILAQLYLVRRALLCCSLALCFGAGRGPLRFEPDVTVICRISVPVHCVQLIVLVKMRGLYAVPHTHTLS